MLEDAKGESEVLNRRKADITTAKQKGQTDKQWSTIRYTEN